MWKFRIGHKRHKNTKFGLNETPIFVFLWLLWPIVLLSALMSSPLLSIQGLETQFFTDDGIVKAVDQVSFDIAPREILGVVGESGSGKSVTALSVLRLVSAPGKITGGKIEWKGRDLAQLSEREMRQIRGDDIAMIFQEPMTSLNPLFTVGNHIQEALLLHQGLKGAAARQKSIEALEAVGIRDAANRVDAYPHQLSGGMRQRVMIAIALSCNPDLLIADEPTTALDVTVQAKILDLMRKLRDERDMAILLITHNMGIVAEMCDRVAVMHRGKIVEMAPINEIFASPRHPYTQQLLKSIPTLDSAPKTPLSTVSWHPTPQQAENAKLVEIGAGHSVSAWAA